MDKPDGVPYQQLFAQVAKHIQAKYHLTVLTGEIRDNNTGDFNGSQIIISARLDSEIALFVLLHLFGHSVQWNISEGRRRLGQESNPRPTEEKLREIETYEQEASRYGMSLLYELQLRDLFQWLSDWCNADWLWLKHLYQTGERVPYRSTFTAGTPLLPPLPIPHFTPQQFASRWSF